MNNKVLPQFIHLCFVRIRGVEQSTWNGNGKCKCNIEQYVLLCFMNVYKTNIYKKQNSFSGLINCIVCTCLHFIMFIKKELNFSLLHFINCTVRHWVVHERVIKQMSYTYTHTYIQIIMRSFVYQLLVLLYNSRNVLVSSDEYRNFNLDCFHMRSFTKKNWTDHRHVMNSIGLKTRADSFLSRR